MKEDISILEACNLSKQQSKDERILHQLKGIAQKLIGIKSMTNAITMQVEGIRYDLDQLWKEVEKGE